jgi:hypothetical protein
VFPVVNSGENLSVNVRGVFRGERRTPHSCSKLGETTDEAGHTDDSVRDGNTARTNVEHGENKGCASEGEETAGKSGETSWDRRCMVHSQRSGVTDDPQLRGGVVNVGVSGERASNSPIPDVVGVADGSLLGGVGHGGSRR